MADSVNFRICLACQSRYSSGLLKKLAGASVDMYERVSTSVVVDSAKLDLFSQEIMVSRHVITSE